MFLLNAIPRDVLYDTINTVVNLYFAPTQEVHFGGRHHVVIITLCEACIVALCTVAQGGIDLKQTPAPQARRSTLLLQYYAKPLYVGVPVIVSPVGYI